MNNSQDYQNLDRYQNVLGQLPMLQVYSHILFPFPMPEGVTREEIIQDLEVAIIKVKEKVPRMAAMIINVGKGPGISGLYKVVPYPPTKKPIYMKDVSHAFPPYSEIKGRTTPIPMLAPEHPAPATVFLQRCEDSEEDRACVVRLQASFVDGQVFLDFVTQHNMTDAAGLFGFTRLIAMATRDEEFPNSFLEQVNQD